MLAEHRTTASALRSQRIFGKGRYGGELSERRRSCVKGWYGRFLLFPEAMLAWMITRTRDCSSFGKSALGHTAGISPGAKPRLSRLGEVGEKLVSRHHNAACREATGSFYMLREGRTSALAPQGSRVYSLWTLIPTYVSTDISWDPEDQSRVRYHMQQYLLPR